VIPEDREGFEQGDEADSGSRNFGVTKLNRKSLERPTVEAAKSSILPHPRFVIGTELVSLEYAHNRVLAQDVEAKIDVPPFDKSTMDGYAVFAEDTFMAEEMNLRN
jgi:molybdopterin biosynthesis enzyme